MEIPIVDFSKCSLVVERVTDEDLETVGRQIYEAFSSIGFVYMKNTGIARQEVDEINTITGQFFQLDLEAKKIFARNEKNYGYIGVNVESINPKRPGDYKEAYNVTSDALTCDDTSWPDELVPGFSTKMRQFCDVCGHLSKRILRALSAGMKIKNPDYFLRCHSRINGKDNFTTLRSLYYPAIPDGVHIKPGQIRLGEHCDYGSFTLLFQDQVGGLQVESYGGNFFEAAPIPDTVLVNIGDILQFWTKGRLKSTKHRVLMPKAESERKLSRRSLAYFVHPDHEVMLSGIEYGASSLPHHDLVKMEYESPVSAYQHVVRRFEKSYS